MNKKIGFVLFALAILGYINEASASIRTIHVEFSYSGTATRYALYEDGVQVTGCSNQTATGMDCPIDLGTTPITFVLTAFDVDNVESPQSAPYVLTPPTLDPATGNYLPQAAMTVSGTAGTAPLLVTFDASASSDLEGTIVRYEWDFGDGEPVDSGLTASHTFTNEGIYTVTLTVTDDLSATAEKTTNITVSASPAPTPSPTPSNQPPTATFTAVQIEGGPSRIQFDATGSSDSDGSIASYAWNFGDGATATGAVVTHDFSATADYTVVLTVTDNGGATKTDQLLLTVAPPPPAPNVLPVAAISASTEKHKLHFEWEYTGADPGLAGFRLYQNGRQVCAVTDPAARQADCLDFVDNGQVHLWVTALDQNGVESGPSAPLSFDSTGLVPTASGGKSPYVIHLSAGTSSDADGTITSYAWNFGDGTTAEGIAVDHTYTLAASYTVTLTVTDNASGQAQTTTVLTVIDATPPLATGASFATPQDKSLTASLSASSKSGAQLSYRVTSPPATGAVTVTDPASGMFTYVPQAGAVGPVSFGFKANDGSADSNEATVTITVQKVNKAPTSSGQSLSGGEDSAISGQLTASDLDNDPLTFAVTTPPQHGTVTITSPTTGAFSYTPAANYNGQDSFTFTASDGASSSAPATVSLNLLPVNDPPFAQAVVLSTGEDTPVGGQLLGVDLDGDSLTYSIVTNGSKGVAVITDPVAGLVSYTPSANANGQDVITYRVSDGSLTVDSTLTITITPVNDPPLPQNDTAKVMQRRTVMINVLANDSDVEGGQLSIAAVATPSAGTAKIVRGKIAYTANANFVGPTSFTYTVQDLGGATAVGTITVTVVE